MSIYFILFLEIILGISNCLMSDDVDDGCKIVGGYPINITEVPHMALFRLHGATHHCGASIISARYLLSAAHCYFKGLPMRITVGTDRVNRGQDYDIEKVVVHPKYRKTENEMDYDILVIKLKKKLVFSKTVAPVKLAEPGLVLKDGEELLVTGFGETFQHERSTSDRLLAVKVPHRSLGYCRQMYGSVISNTMICAGKKGKDSCSADSGGPLVLQKPEGNVQVGIVNFGRSCATEYPGVYASVSAHRSFIDEVVKGNS